MPSPPIPSIERTPSVTPSTSSSLTSTVAPTPSPLTLINYGRLPIASRRAPERQIEGVRWHLVQHPPNVRRQSHSSAIWDHGSEYSQLRNPQVVNWICDHCDSRIQLRKDHSSFNISRHLSSKHQISTKRERSETSGTTFEERKSYSTERVLSIVIAVNIDEFRRKLVRWVVQDQISYSKVRTEAFKELLICL
jgi:uncharacterized protein YlaI